MNPRPRWLSFLLLGVFLFWISPEIISHHLENDFSSGELHITRRVFGFAAGQKTYARDQAETVFVKYHRAYFDLKMRGLYRVGLQFRDGSRVVLHQLQTTLQYEPSLKLGADLKIKETQACGEARLLAAKLSLPVEGCA